MLDYARQANMPLAIEPLHPAYAADRACVNTTKQALDICDALDPQRTGALGVALDVYHIWWDPELLPQIARAGKDRLLAFHVCDWLVPTKDILNDRGMMGDGVIDIKSVRAAVEAQGFAGYSEIEIFSNDWWGKPMDEVLQTCIERHRTVVSVEPWDSETRPNRNGDRNARFHGPVFTLNLHCTQRRLRPDLGKRRGPRGRS